MSSARSYTVGTPQGVVTRDGAKAGTRLSNGSIITTINERPIIAFKGSIPAYRDLAVGARGDDVKQLQETTVKQPPTLSTVSTWIVATTLPGILTEPKKDATTPPCRSLNTSSLTAMNTP